jgi:hypothetical protein
MESGSTKTDNFTAFLGFFVSCATYKRCLGALTPVGSLPWRDQGSPLQGQNYVFLFECVQRPSALYGYI